MSVGRRRCTECRKTFTPARSARKAQRVCGRACRSERDLRLARARRRRELDDFREDECVRQQESRQRRAAAKCHAPPSARKFWKVPQKVAEFVDRALELSRASLLRDLRRITAEIDENVADLGACHAPPSARNELKAGANSS
jgi:hypothetical protein